MIGKIKIFQTTIATLVCILVVVGIAGATSIGTNIFTDGTLTVSGNTNIDSGTLFVDTVNNRVGIGTTTPGSSLEVWGQLGVNGSPIRLKDENATLQFERGGVVYDTLYLDSDNYLHSNNFRVSQNFTAGGRVGIGTTTPWSGAKLHLYDESGTGGLLIEEPTPSIYFANMGGSTNNKNWAFNAYGDNFYGDVAGDLWSGGYHWLEVIRNGLDVDSVNFPLGNVGIGTSSPGANLHVYGGDSADTTVQIGGADSTGGACLKLRDSDGAGWTYCSVLNGSLNCSTEPCDSFTTGGSLTVAETALSAGNAISNETDILLIRFTVTATSTGDIDLTSIALQASSSSHNLTQLSNYTLNDGSSDLQTGVSAVDATTDTVTFSSLIGGSYTIPAGETRTLSVYGDAGAISSENLIQLEMQTAGITAEDSEGTGLSDALIIGDDTNIDGRIVTLVSNGTLTFTTDSSSPNNPHILLSSSSNNSVLAFRADADYEDININTLRFAISGTNATNTVDAVYLYQDGNSVATTTSVDGTYGIVFSSLSGVTVQEDIDSIFELRFDVAGIGVDPEDTATSGDTITFTLSSGTTGVEANGSSSGASLINSDITVTSVASEIQTIYASKVMASDPGGQPTTLSTGNIEVLKFDLTPSTLEGVTSQFTNLFLEGDSSGDVSLTYAYLYNNGLLLASSTVVSGTGGNWLVSFSGFTDDISSSGDDYVIKLDVVTDGMDDSLTTSINVNGVGGSDDDITWKDYSTGSSVTWIDLGEESAVTELSNTISN